MESFIEQRLSLKQNVKLIPKNSNPCNSSPQAINPVFDDPWREYIRDWKNQVDGKHARSRQRPNHPKNSSLPRQRQVRHVRKRQGRYWEINPKNQHRKARHGAQTIWQRMCVMLGFKHWEKQVC